MALCSHKRDFIENEVEPSNERMDGRTSRQSFDGGCAPRRYNTRLGTWKPATRRCRFGTQLFIWKLSRLNNSNRAPENRFSHPRVRVQPRRREKRDRFSDGSCDDDATSTRAKPPAPLENVTLRELMTVLRRVWDRVVSPHSSSEAVIQTPAPGWKPLAQTRGINLDDL